MCTPAHSEQVHETGRSLAADGLACSSAGEDSSARVQRSPDAGYRLAEGSRIVGIDVGQRIVQPCPGHALQILHVGR